MMKSLALILTLTVLTALILAILLFWVIIRFKKERQARRTQAHHDTSTAADNGDSIQLHCTYQPSGAPDSTEYVGGAELRRVRARYERSPHVVTDKAEVWLERGASKDNVEEEGGDVDQVREEDNKAGSKVAKGWGRDGDVAAWDMVGGRPSADGLGGAGRVG